MLAQLTRTAVYGPVRTVVWQGSAGDRGPYADQTAFEEVWAGAAIGGITLPPSRLLARNNFRLAGNMPGDSDCVDTMGPNRARADGLVYGDGKDAPSPPSPLPDPPAFPIPLTS